MSRNPWAIIGQSLGNHWAIIHNQSQSVAISRNQVVIRGNQWQSVATRRTQSVTCQSDAIRRNQTQSLTCQSERSRRSTSSAARAAAASARAVSSATSAFCSFDGCSRASSTISSALRFASMSSRLTKWPCRRARSNVPGTALLPFGVVAGTALGAAERAPWRPRWRPRSRSELSISTASPACSALDAAAR